MPFDNSPPVKRKGLKINNQASNVQVPVKNDTAAFDESAKQAFSRHEDFKQRSFELGVRFKSLIEDKTLVVNKTVIQKDIENEVLTKLVAWANEFNNEETQPIDGAGGTALCQLMMKMMLFQRDKINDLAFQVEKLHKQLVDIKNPPKAE